MISVVKVKYDEVAAGGPARLFRSDRDGLDDGAQSRDFIWVGDIVDIMLWLLEHPGVSGLFNCGTGVARSYLDLAAAVCTAAGQPTRIDFVDMPQALRGQYPVLHPGRHGPAAGGRLRPPVHLAGGRRRAAMCRTTCCAATRISDHPSIRTPDRILRDAACPDLPAVRPGAGASRAVRQYAGMRSPTSSAW